MAGVDAAAVAFINQGWMAFSHLKEEERTKLKAFVTTRNSSVKRSDALWLSEACLASSLSKKRHSVSNSFRKSDGCPRKRDRRKVSSPFQMFSEGSLPVGLSIP